MQSEIVLNPAGNTYVGKTACALATAQKVKLDADLGGETYLLDITRGPEPAVNLFPCRLYDDHMNRLHTLQWGTKALVQAVEQGRIRIIV